jgi:predicted nucleotidyltransferase
MSKVLNCIDGVAGDSLVKLLSLFEQDESISEVILYGSRAKGNYRRGSDIDLTIKGDSLTTGWLMGLAARIDDLLMPYEVDLSIYDHIENSDLREHIQRVGKVIYRK